MSLESRQQTVAIIEDDADLLRSLTTYLRGRGFRTRGFQDGHSFLESLDWSPSIDCIVTDYRLNDIDGLSLMKEIRNRGVMTPVVMITGYGDVPTAVSALKSGAFDFLEKPVDVEALVGHIKRAAEKSHDASLLALAHEAKAKFAKLTGRQNDIVRLVAEGYTSKEIAIQLAMSPRTVDVHRQNAMDKLDTPTLAEMLRLKFMSELAFHEGDPANSPPNVLLPDRS